MVGQLFLANTLVSGSEDEFDACGVSSGSTTCGEDWDRDGVLDESEPTPTSVLEQLRIMECTANGNVQPDAWTVTDEMLDEDELDEDEEPSYSYTDATGGRTGSDGEEAYISTSLEGGRSYLILVGAGGTGTYEISVRQTGT
jgi:hypothetical protein